MNFDDLMGDEGFREAVESFLRVDEITDIFLLGKSKQVRRIIFEEEKDD